jgi:hypothetical protein
LSGVETGIVGEIGGIGVSATKKVEEEDATVLGDKEVG